jgi:hypothetical protein
MSILKSQKKFENCLKLKNQVLVLSSTFFLKNNIQSVENYNNIFVYNIRMMIENGEWNKINNLTVKKFLSNCVREASLKFLHPVIKNIKIWKEERKFHLFVN